MATQIYTIETDENGFIKVQWADLASGDEGQVFDCSGLKLAYVQYRGAFNGDGLVRFEVSDETPPITYAEMHNSGVHLEGSVSMQVEMAGGTLHEVKAIRPVVEGNVEAVTAIALFQEVGA